MKKVRVAYLGFWHSHAFTNPDVMFTGLGVYGAVREDPNIEVLIGWDWNEERGRAGCNALGIPFTTDLEDVLSRDDVDGVVVMCETTLHKEVCIRAAEHGKHIYVNKVLAPTRKEAREIAEAAKKNNVALITMLSRLYENWCVKIRDLIRAGAIGKVISVKIWHAHGIVTRYYETDGMGYLPDGHGFLKARDGAGGCYADMCHPQYMLPFFLDQMPQSIYGRMASVTKRGDIEDNAVTLVDFKDGPYAILEEGWANGPVTTDIQVYGTEGTIMYRDDRSDPDYAYFAVRTDANPKFVNLPILPAEDSPLKEWIRCVQNGSTSEENVRRAIWLSAMNEAAYRSAESGVPCKLSDLEK